MPPKKKRGGGRKPTGKTTRNARHVATSNGGDDDDDDSSSSSQDSPPPLLTSGEDRRRGLLGRGRGGFSDSDDGWADSDDDKFDDSSDSSDSPPELLDANDSDSDEPLYEHHDTAATATGARGGGGDDSSDESSNGSLPSLHHDVSDSDEDSSYYTSDGGDDDEGFVHSDSDSFYSDDDAADEGDNPPELLAYSDEDDSDGPPELFERVHRGAARKKSSKRKKKSKRKQLRPEDDLYFKFESEEQDLESVLNGAQFSFEQLASFLKFPPLGLEGKVEFQSMLLDDAHLSDHIADTKKLKWAREKLTYVRKKNADSAANANIVAPKLKAKIPENSGPSFFKQYEPIVPNFLRKNGSLQLFFCLHGNDQIEVERCISRLDQEPDLLQGTREEIEEERARRRQAAPKECSNCGRASEYFSGNYSLKHCTSCYTASYCDASCQRAHWSRHRPVCRLPVHQTTPKSKQNATPKSSSSNKNNSNNNPTYFPRHNFNTSEIVLHYAPHTPDTKAKLLDPMMGIYKPTNKRRNNAPIFQQDIDSSAIYWRMNKSDDIVLSPIPGYVNGVKSSTRSHCLYLDEKNEWCVCDAKNMSVQGSRRNREEKSSLLTTGWDIADHLVNRVRGYNDDMSLSGDYVEWYLSQETRFDNVHVSATPLKVFEHATVYAGSKKKSQQDDKTAKTSSSARTPKVESSAASDRKKDADNARAQKSSKEEMRRKAKEEATREMERQRKEKAAAEAAEKKRKEGKLFSGEAQVFLQLYFQSKSQDATRNTPKLRDEMTPSEVMIKLFDASADSRLWLHLSDTKTAELLQYMYPKRSAFKNKFAANIITWLEMEAEPILEVSCAHSRRHDMVELLRANVPVRTPLLVELFKTKPKIGDEFSNKLCSMVRRVHLEQKEDFKTVMDVTAGKLSKKAKKSFMEALKRGDAELKKSNAAGGAAKKDQKQTVVSISSGSGADGKGGAKSKEKDKDVIEKDLAAEKKPKKKVVVVPQYRKDFYVNFDELIQWHIRHLEGMKRGDNVGDIIVLGDLMKSVSLPSQFKDVVVNAKDSKEKATEKVDSFQLNPNAFEFKPDISFSNEEAATELQKCLETEDEFQQEEIVERVAAGISLDSWGEGEGENEWIVEITEQAHKWFKKRAKKSHTLCTRVLRRLKLLSTGRWPYVLKKPLKTRSNLVKLYESKIDSGMRIVWEIAIAFSPRRSSQAESFCEHVVRVWDIVEDHDNLTRAIDLAVERVERSHKRGKECMIYAELDSSAIDTAVDVRDNLCAIPSVFLMKSGMQTRVEIDGDSKGATRKKNTYHPPASSDNQQYTLMKFYALNTRAVEQLLSSESNELPFTPGPKEYEIIQHKCAPPRSMLLMGRSGTGKTTCLVFRMWSQFMAYASNADPDAPRPRQMFLTKNDVLKVEVRKAFLSMGIAYRKSSGTDGNSKRFLPKFFSSSEWLDSLDEYLPGEKFFTKAELHRRANTRKEDIFNSDMDTFTSSAVAAAIAKGLESIREEMTYSLYRRFWKKMNSRILSLLDPALVYLEIKSFIKGSIAALHLECLAEAQMGGINDMHIPARYLAREEYLALPKKMSRMDEAQRNEVYDLFENYERIKKEGNFYDEMDLVHNLTTRAYHFHRNGYAHPATGTGSAKKDSLVLPLDSVFVDEVQDFTQVEIFLLVKLSRDANNLMMAGDTAQSIAVGVGFRFVDVRQIFYESFGGTEPNLLQLVHNYRSHAGVLQLAACVVELLYYFFNDSLDTLPPDQGLFNGPKPIIIEVVDPAELVILMNGSKRETSRIEFGAHQVILVRNEEAKRNLPEEFVSDKDWIMTVQEAKGLEFDDVLLYNFFTDSDASELWRVVSNYKEEQVHEFYSKINEGTAGTKSYEWCDLEKLQSTRHLEFNREQHKVLESELKILYTAITRARVNVFIAEDDVKMCRPMFNYFKQRGVVEVVDKSTQDMLSKLNVFGKSGINPDDWLKRGEIYLNQANNNRRGRSHMLRLASKCFKQAGDEVKEKIVLAELAYAEMEESHADNQVTKRKGTSSVVQEHKKIYGVALQLLEARDARLLAKAGKCIIQAGEFERGRSAQALELSARLSYTSRQMQFIHLRGSSLDRDDIAPDEDEQQHFNYAGKLLLKCLSDDDFESEEKRKDYLLRAIYNLLSSGTDEDLKQVNTVLSSYSPGLVYSIVSELSMVLKQPEENDEIDALSDPLRYFHWLIRESPEEVEHVVEHVKATIVDACAYYLEKGDQKMIDIIPTIGARADVTDALGTDASSQD